MIARGNIEEESGINSQLGVVCLAEKWAISLRVRPHEVRGEKVKKIAFST